MLKTITSFVDSLGSLTYKGLWNAATNTPTLASGVGTTGDYYVVSVPGTTTLDGISSWAAGDWAIFNGSVWEKYNNPADALGEVLANGNTTAGTDISVTTGDDITFADNSKAIFGAGNDLQIYHDGSHSYISEQGTGDLRVYAQDFQIRNADGSNTMLYANAPTGGIQLFHTGEEKLATSASGISVTGTVTADGLTVDSSGTPVLFTNGDGLTQLGKIVSDSTYGLVLEGKSNSNLALKTKANGAGEGIYFLDTSDKKRMFIEGTTGDISFYDTAGTSQALFWDASAESLGIGTDSPSTELHVLKSGSDANVTIESTGTGSDARLNLYANSTGVSQIRFGDEADTNIGLLTYDHSDNSMQFRVNDSERMRIASSGYVGIGTTSPSRALSVFGDTSGVISITSNSTDGISSLSFGDTADDNAGRVNYLNASDEMLFYTATAERMRISSGNLLVGKTTSDLGVTAGIELNGQYDVGYFTRSAEKALVVNRLSTDGTIAEFRKDGTRVGSIGTESNRLTIGTDDTGLIFSSLNYIRPWNPTANIAADADISLGGSNDRFKNLYLSGGVVFGTTGGSVSSKTLDDYEEGTWDGVITDGTNNATMVDTECFYTKTGRLVTLSGDISTSALGSVAGSSIRISGVPFTNGAKGVSAAIGRASGLAITAGHIPTLYFDASSSALRLGLFDNAGGTTTLQATEWTDDGQISFSITYTTA